MPERFTVRVYGLLIEDGRVLLSDEWIRGREITKFPGGGLELGEGPAQGLAREFREELDMEVEVDAHFYTTDFFVQSAFDPRFQVIAIYYLVKNVRRTAVAGSARPHDYEKKKGAQSFRWCDIGKIREADLSLETDKVVAGIIMKKYSGT
jgi:8-oxo-dGTP diphosphatase